MTRQLLKEAEKLARETHFLPRGERRTISNEYRRHYRCYVIPRRRGNGVLTQLLPFAPQALILTPYSRFLFIVSFGC